MTFDPKPIRWIELGLPHPHDPERMMRLKADGPFALRRFYFTPDRDAELELHLDERTQNGGLNGCLACGGKELFARKDFPPALGITIVVVAAVLAPFTMYISLAVAALLDFILYQTARESLVCYRCSAEHNGFAKEPRHPRFDRTIAERLKFGEKAVMGSPMREGGTANAPDPEH
ncbi:MAG: hypothetical protein GY711_03550 [bacterium]|nr:hypothetical protein [bacterium]